MLFLKIAAACLAISDYFFPLNHIFYFPFCPLLSVFLCPIYLKEMLFLCSTVTCLCHLTPLMYAYTLWPRFSSFSCSQGTDAVLNWHVLAKGEAPHNTHRSVYTAKRKTIWKNPGLNEKNTRRHDDKHQCLVTQRILIEKCNQKLHPVHIAGYIMSSSSLCCCFVYSNKSIRTFTNVFKIYIWFYSWRLTNKSSNKKLHYTAMPNICLRKYLKQRT